MPQPDPRSANQTVEDLEQLARRLHTELKMTEASPQDAATALSVVLAYYLGQMYPLPDRDGYGKAVAVVEQGLWTFRGVWEDEE